MSLLARSESRCLQCNVVPLAPTKALAQRAFTNLIYHEVDDDHSLHATVQAIDWPMLVGMIDKEPPTNNFYKNEAVPLKQAQFFAQNVQVKNCACQSDDKSLHLQSSWMSKICIERGPNMPLWECNSISLLELGPVMIKERARLSILSSFTQA